MDDSPLYHLVYILKQIVMYVPRIWYHRISEVTIWSLCETLSSPRSLSSLLIFISSDRHLWPLQCEALPISEIPFACSPSGLVLIMPPSHDSPHSPYHVHVSSVVTSSALTMVNNFFVQLLDLLKAFPHHHWHETNQDICTPWDLILYIMELMKTTLQHRVLEGSQLHTLDWVLPDLLCCPNLIHQVEVIEPLVRVLHSISAWPNWHKQQIRLVLVPTTHGMSETVELAFIGLIPVSVNATTFKWMRSVRMV